MTALQFVPENSRAQEGIFITFEGGERVGKSTQIKLLQRKLQDYFPQVQVRATFEPGATDLGQKLRGILQHEPQGVDAKTEALLFAADRAHHVESFILPHLMRGGIVLCDRYLDSSVAYQGAGRGLGESVKELSLWATGNLLPDLTILLDAAPELVAERQLGPEDRLERESLDFHRQVRARFLEIAEAEPGRVRVIDALGTPEEVSQQIWDAVNPVLQRKAQQ